MNFEFDLSSKQTAIIRVPKAHDFRNLSEFRELTNQLVRDGVRNFVLDYSATGILDSGGLGSVFSLYRRVSPLDGQIVFAACSRPVQIMVQLTRTYKVFRQFLSVEEAITNIKATK